MRDSLTCPYLSLIIPAYNEAFRIRQTIQTAARYLEARDYTWELVIVDDGSVDGTLDAAKSCLGESSQIRLISYQPNRGKGYAVRQGVFAARGEYIAFSDADFSAPLEELSKLFDAIDRGYEVAIGSRAVKESQLGAHQPLYRELGGKALNLVVQALAVPGVHDTQCGFKLFVGDVAREVFSKCFIDSWGFDIEVLFLARSMGCSIAEIGVKWDHGEGSKLHPFRDALRVIWDVLRMRAHHHGRTST